MRAIKHSANPMKPIPSVPWLITDSIVSFGFKFSEPFQSVDINNGNCFARAVFWKLKRSCNWRAVSTINSSNFAINALIRDSLFSISRHSNARRTMLIVENEMLPRPIDVFSPKRFSNTRVRQPIVATSYL